MATPIAAYLPTYCVIGHQQNANEGYLNTPNPKSLGIQSDRKRFHDESPENVKRDLSSSIKTIEVLKRDLNSSMKTIEVLKAQVSDLQRLHFSNDKPFATSSTSLVCQICGTGYGRLDYLNKHIRSSNEPTHKMLAIIINETYCIDCNISCNNSRGLVRHERQSHGEKYISRLDKVLGGSVQAHRCKRTHPYYQRVHTASHINYI